MRRRIEWYEAHSPRYGEARYFRKDYRMRRIYVAGPMRGIADLNFPEFFRTAALWESRGWETVNPAQMDISAGHTVDKEHVKSGKGIDFKEAMDRDLPAVASCDAIALMAGWERSQGANKELEHARVLGKEVYDAETGMLVNWMPVR